jgi:hypothetical protein
MANQNPTDPVQHDPDAAAELDAKTQQAVFGLILVEDPAQLTIEEIVKALCSGSREYGERDAVERAVRDLANVGLLHSRCGFVSLTRAVRHLLWLEEI